MLLPDFSSAKILVAGDVMLDRYWFGDVHRISPEAPVPVCRVEREESRPGGAANVARNIASLGAKTLLLSITGKDETAKQLETLASGAKASPRFIVDDAYKTTVKLRVIGRQQQLLRIDFETSPSKEAQEQLLNAFRENMADCGAVVLSDYAKGALDGAQKMIQIAHDANRKVIVDPKGDDWEKYRGADVITPNRGELAAVAGSWKDEETLRTRAMNLMRDMRFGALLLTRSEEGMSLFDANGVTDIPTHAREVYDVSGAGDTVVAVAAAAMAAGMKLIDAVRVANVAAGIVVGKFGTATVTAEELQKALNA